MMPTPGRIVWYRGKDGFIRSAIIGCVHNEVSVNLTVFPLFAQDTECGPMDFVGHADPDLDPDRLGTWHWMPYQLQQAKKTEVPVASPILRQACLDMALRMPSVTHYNDALTYAKEFEKFILGHPDHPPVKEKIGGY